MRSAILTFGIFIWTSIIFGQITGTSFELNEPVPSNETKDWRASDFIKMTFNLVTPPGSNFSASPDVNNYVRASIDPFYVEPPGGGETGGPIPGDNGVVGAIPGNLGVAPNGTATYTIPIEAPPGVSGMTPELSVVYNSMGGDGVLGPGWSLAGISSISNVRPTPYYSDYWGVNYEGSYFNWDNFVLDGQRLIRQYPVAQYQQGEYRLENDNFTRIKKHQWNNSDGIYFSSETKGGLIYYYGGHADSRHRVITSFNPNQTVISYNVNSVTDRFGNVIEYEYESKSTTGECYIKKISYGNGGEVIFTYDDRDDPIVSRLQHKGLNVEFKVTQRLTTITTKYNGSVYRNYTFEYKPRGTNAEQYLEKVSLVGVKGEHYNKTLFTWSDLPSQDWEYNDIQHQLPNSDGSTGQSYSADFNGDGLQDLCVLVSDYFKTGTHNDVIFSLLSGKVMI